MTGIAGPGGGTPEKPVGLVFLHAAGPDGERALEFSFPGDRESIRAPRGGRRAPSRAAASDTESRRTRVTSAASVGGDERLRLFLALGCPTPMLDDLADVAASASSRASDGSSRASTCTSRSRSSAAARRRARRDRRGACARPRAPARPDRARARRATGRRGASGCSCSRPIEARRATARRAPCTGGLEALGVYERETRAVAAARHACSASASAHGSRAAAARRSGEFAPSDAAAYLSRLHPTGARYEVLGTRFARRRMSG